MQNVNTNKRERKVSHSNTENVECKSTYIKVHFFKKRKIEKKLILLRKSLNCLNILIFNFNVFYFLK